MIFLIALALAVAADPGAADFHELHNSVYRELRQTGLAVGTGTPWTLPASFLPSEYPATQKALLPRLAGDDYDLGELTRRSVTAPFVLRITGLEEEDSARDNAYRIDLWFIAHGNLSAFKESDAEQKILQLGRSDLKVRFLEASDLQARGIRVAEEDAGRDRYVYATYSLLDRIEVSLTSRHFFSRTENSVLLAGVPEPRFLGDKAFPNQWRRINRDQDPPTLGLPQPASFPIGQYQKITRLAEPAGALFVEYHAVIVEPHAWFNGTNVLRSKLRLLIQSEVRTFRRELARD